MAPEREMCWLWVGRQRQADVTLVGTQGSVCRSCTAWNLVFLGSFFMILINPQLT